MRTSKKLGKLQKWIASKTLGLSLDDLDSSLKLRDECSRLNSEYTKASVDEVLSGTTPRIVMGTSAAAGIHMITKEATVMVVFTDIEDQKHSFEITAHHAVCFAGAIQTAVSDCGVVKTLLDMTDEGCRIDSANQHQFITGVLMGSSEFRN